LQVSERNLRSSMDLERGLKVACIGEEPRVKYGLGEGLGSPGVGEGPRVKCGLRKGNEASSLDPQWDGS